MCESDEKARRTCEERSYDVNEAAGDQAPCPRREIDNAKLYLRKFCPEAGDTLYDHLSEVLNKILAERPKNPFAAFDEYSRRLKDDKFRLKNDYLRDACVSKRQFEDARILVDLFKENLSINEDDDQSIGEEENHEDDFQVTKIKTPNLSELFYYFEQVDVGLPRGEIVLLNLSIRKLVANAKIEDARFWGKILGREKNYYVIEARLPDHEIERRLQLEREEQRGSLERVSADDGVEQTNGEKKPSLETKLSSDEAGEDVAGEKFTEDGDTLKLVLPPIPINTWSPAPKVFPEKLGTGVNAKVYFVCNAPGLDDWVELPAVTPEQIVAARQIVHAFTGNLEAQIYTFPPFPGCEKNYLRAQIARIGAATQVSPIGYYGRRGLDEEGGEEEEDEEDELEDEEEEEEKSEGGGNGLVPNPDYKPLSAKELTDPSNWCHHVPYILEQGREVWLEPGKADDDKHSDESDASEEGEDDGADEEEEEEGAEGSAKSSEGLTEKEIGPGLFRPLSEDAARPWTGRLSSVQPDAAVALVRSNLWPGAFAFAADKKFGNVYIGWGQKQPVYNYSPPRMPEVQEQYVPIGGELEEAQDPSFEEEDAYRVAHLPPEHDDEEDEEEEASEAEEEDSAEDQV